MLSWLRIASVINFLTFLLQLAFVTFKAVLRKLLPAGKKSIRGEVALVTGAGHGIGRSFALKLASLGAKVILVDIDETSNLETVTLLRDAGANPYYYTCDLSKKHEIKKLVKDIKRTVSFVSILVSNAGIICIGDIMANSDDSIQRTFDVNTMAHFWLIKAFLPGMMERNHGHIVAMSSVTGRIAAPLCIDYSSSKHAVVGLMEGLARELRCLGKTGVKTTYACPTHVDTGFSKVDISRSKIIPSFTPEHVVDLIVNAMVTNQPYVDIPPQRLALFIRTFFPKQVWELIMDHVSPKIAYNGKTYPKV